MITYAFFSEYLLHFEIASCLLLVSFFFFFNDTATTEIYTLSLHDALPISFSHGTQDLYPTFLQKNHGFTPKTVGLIAIIYNIGALLGGVIFGAWSEKIGRRKAILIA